MMANTYFRFRQFTIFQDRCSFKVGTDGVLLGACSDLPSEGRILDIGTGTGLIAIMAAQRTSCDIVGIEPDHETFLQASDNVAGTPWSDRIHLYNVSFQEFCRDPWYRFEAILSNPPYFRDSLKNQDTARARTRHNDTLSSDDLIEGITTLLSETGSLQVILPYAEGNLFIAEAAERQLFCTGIIKVRPTPGSRIKRLILKFEQNRREPAERFLTIEKGIRHHYTDEYKEIMKDYFLK